MAIIRRLHALARWQKVILCLILVLSTVAGSIYGWIFKDLPSINHLEAGFALPSTRIYDRSGRLLYEILPPEQGRHRLVDLKDIPQHCVNAAIATEDANFYNHLGIDITGIVRAIWINLRGGEILAGGSTITQQTARLLLLDPQQRLERTLQRKLREMVLALQLQHHYSKDEIIELYLNQNYFGNLAYGIEAAAQTYFAKSAAELSLAECTLLAGLMQNPTSYDPLINLETAQTRQEIVLELMIDNDFITQAQASAALRDSLQFASTRFPIEAPHFVMAVWKQLERQYPAQIYGGGLEVTTTVDTDWQNAAQRIAQLGLETLNNPLDNNRVPANAHNVAIVALDPFTGAVRTMLGSPDYFNEMIDGSVNAALAMRQPGSTLKPFTYAAAMNPQLDDPYTAATMIMDIQTAFVTRKFESYSPANYALVEHGPVRVREALASSYNIPAVVALNHTGIEAMVDLADNAGLSTLAENTYVDLSITLGGGEVRLLDLTQAYSIFPNGGYRIAPYFIETVKTHSGETVYQHKHDQHDKYILDERIAYIITDILSDEEARIPSFGRNSALSIGRPVAAKTGTTTDFRDNWVIGYTPNLVVGVWVGNADNSPMVDVSGISGAGPIWNRFIREVLTGQPKISFKRPDGLLETEVCALSGLLPTQACQLRHMELFIPGTVPDEEDTFHQTFIIDRQTNLLADENTPEDRKMEQVYIVLPQEARNWAIRNNIRQPPSRANIPASEQETGLRLLSPAPYTVFQISPILPTDVQRIRLDVAVPKGTETVSYTLNDKPIGTATNDTSWSVWWPLESGQYELQAIATHDDGTTQTSDSVYFTVTLYEESRSHTVTHQ